MANRLNRKQKPKRRISKEQYYLNIAQEVSKRGTCLRRNFGAVIVKEDQIIATGYSGAPRGTANCIDIGKCLRQELKVPKGKRYELCRGVHAEQNAIIHASRLDMLDAALYLVGLDVETDSFVGDSEPCLMCKRIIINAGIKWVHVEIDHNKTKRFRVADWVSNNLDELKKNGSLKILKEHAGY